MRPLKNLYHLTRTLTTWEHLPLSLKTISSVFSKGNKILIILENNKINQVLKNIILFFLFFTLASGFFSYVLLVFLELRHKLTLNKTVVLICT